MDDLCNEHKNDQVNDADADTLSPAHTTWNAQIINADTNNNIDDDEAKMLFTNVVIMF